MRLNRKRVERDVDKWQYSPLIFFRFVLDEVRLATHISDLFNFPYAPPTSREPFTSIIFFLTYTLQKVLHVPSDMKNFNFSE